MKFVMEDRNSKVKFEETELRLGMPGGGGGGGAQEGNDKETTNANGKRSFAQSSMLDLKLKLGYNEATCAVGCLVKKQKHILSSTQRVPKLPPAKAQLVGWPPVQSFRSKIIAEIQKSSLDQANDDKVSERSGAGAAALVKVSMHGTPYLRNVDLTMYKNYRELSDALANMFHSFASGGCQSQRMIGFMKDSSMLIDILNSSQYVPTYEDKYGNWLLVGDVPWEMFVESCKRLRIMKGAEATKLAPRALEKFKNLQMKLNI